MSAFAKKRKRTLHVRAGRIMIFGASLFLAAYFVYIWMFHISPNIEEIAGMKGRGIITQAVNETVQEQFGDEMSAKNLLIVETDESGAIEMVQSDTVAINSLVSRISKELQKKYTADDFKHEIKVPFGSLLGSQVLSQHGPMVTLTIIPIGVSSMDFITEFESQGINQTKYKVYLVLETEARVIAPFSSEIIDVKNTILIAEAVILGKVPQSYVNVPDDAILDGMDTGEFDTGK